MLTYNNKNEHSTTNMKPSDAIKEDNRLDVKINLELKAKRDRRYPELKVGDKVKIMLRYNKFRKEHNPLYSDSKYEIEKNRTKAWVKHVYRQRPPTTKNELLKIA